MGQRRCKQAVIVQARCQLAHMGDKVGILLELVLGQCLKLLQPRTVIRLGEHHVKSQQRDLVVFKQGVRERGHLVAGPRPATLFSQAFFIHVNDDDAVIQGLWHRRPQARVINRGVNTVQRSDWRKAQGMGQDRQQQSQR